MMLTRVEVQTPQGQTLTLSLIEPNNGLIVSKIDGLDPVKATIVTSQQALLDGMQYQSSRREMRNIVISVDLEPDYASTDVRGLRALLYQYFMPKSIVDLRFYMDEQFYASISARVESCETPMFTSEPQMTISLLCPDPDFVAPIATRVLGVSMPTVSEMLINYEGTAETGIFFRFLPNRAISQFTIYNRPQGAADFQMMEFAAPLVSLDELQINTVGGNKSATLIRTGTSIPMLYGVSPTAAWIQLYPGQNWFRVLAEGASIPYTVDYVAKYGGL